VPILENVLVWPGGAANHVLSRNGTLAYRAGDVRAGFPKQLVWVDRQGKEELLPEPPRDFSIPRISPDGDRVALNIVEKSRIGVWVYDLGRGTFTRLTFDPDWELNPIWSPDGDTIAFTLFSPKEIRVISADGSSPSEKIASSEFIATLSSWSPDGKTLAITEKTSRNDDIKTLAVEGDGKLKDFLATESMEEEAVFSPDGHWIAYASNETGRFEIYVRPFPGPGGKWQVSNSGGNYPLWSRDGRELFYRNGNRMMVAKIEPGETFRSSRPEVLFEGAYAFHRNGRNYDVSPDGKRFLMVKELDQQRSTAPTMELILNWHEELRRRAPVR